MPMTWSFKMPFIKQVGPPPSLTHAARSCICVYHCVICLLCSYLAIVSVSLSLPLSFSSAKGF